MVLACWFEGEEAVLAAAEDGEESPPPNDYHTRNDHDLLRVQPVADGAEVVWYPDPGDPDSVEIILYAEWWQVRLDRRFQLAAWLNIDDGLVVSIEEQWVP